jgi:hypothetical protein
MSDVLKKNEEPDNVQLPSLRCELCRQNSLVYVIFSRKYVYQFYRFLLPYNCSEVKDTDGGLR